MSRRRIALPTEDAGMQITLICTSQTIIATRRDLRQIGGDARIAGFGLHHAV
jgi:hypothetical protein